MSKSPVKTRKALGEDEFRRYIDLLSPITIQTDMVYMNVHGSLTDKTVRHAPEEGRTSLSGSGAWPGCGLWWRKAPCAGNAS